MLETYLQFRRPAHSCLLCGADISAIGRHRSALKLEDAAEQAVREDLCDQCWDRLGERNYFSFWVTQRFQEGPSVQQRRLAKAERNEALWALFNALNAVRSEEVGPQLFLLAHLLMKHRVLQFTGRSEDGRLQFYHGPTQETYLIEDMPLDAVSFVDVMQGVEGQLHEYAPADDPDPADAQPAEAPAAE